MIKNFTHLHVHTHYSLLDGLPKIDELIAYVQKLGMNSVAITDHGALYGAVEFYKKAKKAGVKPLIGCEVYVAIDGMDQKRPGIDDKRYHLVLLAKNEKGYSNLVKLVTKSHLEGFYYKPRIDEELLARHSEGLIGLSACVKGKVPYLASVGKAEQAVETALKYRQIFGPENFFLEVQEHPSIPSQIKTNEILVDFSKKLNIPLVATNDCHYLRKDDAEAQDILMLINTGAKSDDPERLTMKNDDFSVKSPEEMAAFCGKIGAEEAIPNTQRIAEMCDFEFKLGETKLPPFETPQAQNPNDYLKKLCYEGLDKKSKEIEDKEAAAERLEYELSVIEGTGFASYFLIVQDFVNWAKQNRIVVGPGRGSAAGSLVAFLLNITEVEPIKHGLLFERFLNPSRVSMPDIDLDFADRRRDEVINYVAEKYGRDRVAQIITFGTMAARAVIRDVGRAMGISYGFCDQVAKMIPFGMNLEQCIDKVKEFRQLYQTDEQAKKLIDAAKKLEGVARHASTHACGVIISNQPLDEIVPLQRPTQDDATAVTQYELHSIDDLGLLKMDFLGLKNLTIIEDALARIYKVRGESIDLSQIPMNDSEAMKLFKEAKTTGVFQLESSGMKRYLKELRPTDFDDIVAMIALYRPGPMQFLPDYIERKNKRKPVEYMHPKLKPILEKTQGICIYQEQLMQIARDVAGFSLSEADILRKAIGKKIPELLKAQKDKFVEGVIKNNATKSVGEKLWEWILPFAQYGFNKSHSVAYGMIAYNTAYLKAHYPVEFMAALLTSEKNDVERISFVIDECKSMGIEVLAPDINESFRNFSVTPDGAKIRFGLLAIKNVGENIVTAILDERKNNGPFESFSDFAGRIESKDFNKKSMESLIKAGVFDKFEERSILLNNLEEVLGFNREIRKAKSNTQASLFGFSSIASPVLRLANADAIPQKQKILWEKELLGLFISSHPLDSVKHILRDRTMPLKELKENNVFYSSIRVGGIISSVKKIITKKGQPMVFMQLQDMTDKAEVVVFPSILEANPEVFQENKIVFITGKKDVRDGEPKIIAQMVEEILEA
ncbi:MAG: DNA polymerase III subunit alpha [Candidatus Pacebacteria bacterium]|nr:DNA polymerase III subunit alpha [Candidatus Paceibacterota bacterium]